MNAGEHLAAAEKLLSIGMLDVDGRPGPIDLSLQIAALGHAVIAVGIELGVPHSDSGSGQVSSGTP